MSSKKPSGSSGQSSRVSATKTSSSGRSRRSSASIPKRSTSASDDESKSSAVSKSPKAARSTREKERTRTSTRTRDSDRSSRGTVKEEKPREEKEKEKAEEEKPKARAKPKAKAAKAKAIVEEVEVEEEEEDESQWVLGDDGYYYCIEETVVEVVDGEERERTTSAVSAAEKAKKKADEAREKAEQARAAAEEQARISMHIQRAISAAEEQVRESYGNIFQGIEDNTPKKKEKSKDKKKNWMKEESSSSVSRSRSGSSSALRKRTASTTQSGSSTPEEDRGRSHSPRRKVSRSSRSPGSSSSTIAGDCTSSPGSKTPEMARRKQSRSRSRGRAVLATLSGKKDPSGEPKKRNPSILSLSGNKANKSHSSFSRPRSVMGMKPIKKADIVPVKQLPSQSPDYDTTKLFGVDLDVVMARQERDKVPGDVPVVIAQTVDFVRKNGIDSSGLFRLCGHHSTQMALEKKLDEGETDLDLSDIDIHTVAGLLKSFLLRLPFPIVPRSPFFSLFFSASALTCEVTRIRTYGSLLHAIPPHSLALIRYLCLFLSDVAEHHTVSLMTASNLALIFAPSFFGTMEDDLTDDMLGSIEPLALCRASKFTASITEQLIIKAKEIFLEEPFAAKVYKSMECFRALGGNIMTILRGDTLLVIHEDKEDKKSTVMVGETWGRVPTKILSEMKLVGIEEVQCRDTASLFTNKSSAATGSRHGGQTIAIRNSDNSVGSAPSSPAFSSASSDSSPPSDGDKKKGHRRGRSLGKVTTDKLTKVLEGSKQGRKGSVASVSAGTVPVNPL